MKQITKWFNPVMLVVILLPFFQYFATGVQTVMAEPNDITLNRDITTINGNEDLKTTADGAKTILDSAVVNPSSNLKVGDPVTLQYNWSVPESFRENIQEGDYFKFALPANFDGSGMHSMDITDSDNPGKSLGIVKFDGAGTATMVFHKLTSGNISGIMTMRGFAARSEGTDNTASEIPFVANDTNNFPPVETNNGTALSKSHGDVKYSDDGTKADITWKLTVNSNANKLVGESNDKAADLTDTLPQGVSDISDVKVTAKKLQKDGSFADDTDSNDLLYQKSTDTDASGNKVVHFAVKQDTNDEFDVEYKTTVSLDDLKTETNGDTIKGGNSTSVTNAASLANNDNTPSPATDTVQLGYSANLKKTSASFDEKTGLIQWQISLNKDGNGPIPAGTKITDTLNNGQTIFDKDGNPMTDDQLSKLAGDNWSVSKNGNDYTITANNTDAGNFNMVYYTKPKEGYDAASYDKATFDKNTNDISWGGQKVTVPPTEPKTPSKPGDGDGNGQGNPGETLKPSIDKTTSGSAYEQFGSDQKLVNSWQIVVNKEHANAKNLVITDTMSDGLTLLTDDKHQFVVTADENGHGNQQTLSPSDYTLTPANGGHGFTLDLKDWTAKSDDNAKSKVTVQYKTIQTTKDGQSNSSSFTSDGGNNDTNGVPPAAISGIGLNKDSIGGFNSTTGTIKWRINFNGERKLLASDGVLLDPIPVGWNLLDAKDSVVEPDGAVNGGIKVTDGSGKDVTANVKISYVKSVPDDILSKFVPSNDRHELPTKDNIKNGAIMITGFNPDDDQNYNVEYTTKLTNDGSGTNDIMHKVSNTAFYEDSNYGTVSDWQDENLFTDGDMLQKSGLLLDATGAEVSGSAAENATHAKFSVTVHPAPGNFVLKDNTVTDTFGANVIFDKAELGLTDGTATSGYQDVFTVKYADGTALTQVPLEDAPKQQDTTIATPTYSVEKHQQGFTLTFNGKIDKPVVVTYTTALRHTAADELNNGYTPTNTAKLTGNYTTGDVSSNIDRINLENGSASGSGVLGSLHIVKEGPDGEKLKDAEFDLQDSDGDSITTLTTDDNGVASADNLDPGKYTLIETKAPAGYQKVAKQDVTVAPGSDQTTAPVQIVDPKAETTAIKGQKTWNDNDNQYGWRPDGITVDLLANGEKTQSKTVTAKDNWQYAFTDLTKQDNDGKDIVYTVKEEPVNHYASTVDGSNITNTPEVTNVAGTKTWDDANNQEGFRPDSVTINLLANGSKVNSKTVTAADNWQYDFGALPTTDDKGNQITYTINEDAVNGYTSKVDGYNVTNTHTPQTTSFEGKKTWQDSDNQDGTRPASITVDLLADGKKVDSKTVTAADKWEYKFDNLAANKNGKAIQYSVTEEPVAGYTSTVDGNNITNTHAPETTEVSGTKTWTDNNNQDGRRPTSITVNLIADGVKVQSQTVTAANNWQYNFTGLPKNANGQPITYTIEELPVPGYTTSIQGYNLTNTYTPETTQVSGTKTWKDADDQDGKRPSSITVNLLADGTKTGVTQTVSKKDNWQYSFNNLPKYENGKEISYTVTEDKVDGYTSTVDKDNNITNTHTPDVTSVSGTKMWSDDNNQDGARPDSITVDLLADGQKVDSKQVTAADAWQYKFTNLPKFDNGKEIKYTVAEDVIPDGYSSEVDGTNILNTYTPETVNVEGHKTWADANNQDGKRPSSITVDLLANGLQVDQRVVTAKDNWEYSFKNLPKNANGIALKYTVAEEAINDENGLELYKQSVDGYNLTNTYTPETTQVSGTKTWKDADNQDGKRPSSITVKLLADGTEVQSKKVTAADKWQYSFANLPAYKNGKKIAYTIDEDAVAGYTKKISGDDLTNTYTPETTQVAGTKTWDDANNQDGKRPDSINVELLKNGQEFKHQTVTAADNWQYSFTDLPKYENGKQIVYTIDEAKVDGYKKSVAGYDLTNSYTPATTEISGKKTWDDADNQDGKRPDSITVNLLADGQKVQSKKVTAADNWQYSFTNLAEYKDGVKINYTIDEDSPAGYIKTIKGNDLTNSYRPEETQVEGYKVWDDANDQDGLRPNSITVNLLANGKKIQSKTVTAKDDWRYNFTGLPKNDHGKKIVYTIDETSVAGYSKKIAGYDLTNTHQPATTKVTGTKNWNDNNNQDGKRPDSITVYLLADGKKVQSKQVSAGDNWQYSFTNLPQYANGKQINYTIDESDVAGYTKTVRGTNLTNTHTPDQVAVTGTKTWNDADNQDGKRPSSITVTLLANGKAVQTRTVTAATNWEYNFTNLPKYDNGQVINYTVDENAVAGYTKTVNGYDLTNTHTPETTAVAGTKTWNDNDDQDGKRPESITVRLLANGIEAASKKVTAADNWQYSFTDLPKYADGKVIVYTVAEDAVAGYTTTTDGDNLTNTHTPEVTEVSGTKTWLDDDDMYGMRPESITVHLLANGKKVDTKEVTADDNWQYSFTNLPVFAKGKQIVYSISEDEVDGYTSSVDGYDLTNTILPVPPLPNTFGHVPPTGPHTPNQPRTPNQPNQPKTPHTPGQPGNGGHLPDTFGGLPQTGDDNDQWVLTLLGAGMLVTLLAIALRKREELKA